MSWKKTSCPICYHNCGLEIQTEGHRITKVRPDKEHPRTQGYICRKGMKVGYFQDHKQRLKHPLKKQGDTFVEISWEQAISEIASKLKDVINKHGPRSFGYMGGGGQGCHMEAPFGLTLLGALGSQYHYSAIAQELTGLFWVNGRAYGGQNLHLYPDLDRAEVFLVMGWNGAVSNAGVNRARNRINEFSKDPDKQLIVLDPLLSETAKRANKHLKLRSGTNALFFRSLIAIILQEGWENKAYIAEHCQDFEKIAPWFKDFDVAPALEMCGLSYDEVKEVARIYSSRPTAIRSDLGLLMDRQSTMNSYLEMILMAICGRIGAPGGNVFGGHAMPLGSHTDERDEKTWRTVETDFPAIMGVFPPNVAPEEILSQKDARLRAMIVSNSNPLRSYADTLAYERAFKELELLVTVEISMSETARLSHYVLPAKSAFEKWDATVFNLAFPEIYFQLRHPHCESQGEPREEGEIYTLLAEELGILPDIPESLFQAATKDRVTYAMELMKAAQQDKKLMRLLPLVVAKTLGKTLNSAHLAGVWSLVGMYPQHGSEDIARAGYEVTPLTGDMLFQKLLDHPEGILLGKVDPDANLKNLKTSDGKIHLYIEEMKEWMEEIEPEAEEKALKNEEYPFILSAGRHFPYQCNTNMRDPAWNDHKPVCTLLISEKDAQAMGIADGEDVCVTTETSSVTVPAEVSKIATPGVVVLPHGFGLVYEDQEYGVNVNALASAKFRDRIAATPLHRSVPCRISKI
jgi:anaerobic selenocysteine-containing dehydrogenase